MMKRIICFIAVVTMVMTAAVCTMAADSGISISYIDVLSESEGKLAISVSVENNTQDSASGIAYFCVFDDASLIAVNRQECVLPSGNSEIGGECVCESMTEGVKYTVKTFIWSEDMQPVSDKAETEYTYTSDSAAAVELQTNLFCSYNSAGGLSFYENDSTSLTTIYRLDTDWKLIVNGAVVDNGDAWIEYFLDSYNNPDMTVTLTDSSADGLYDTVSVDYAVTAVVDSIVMSDDKSVINFRAMANVPVGSTPSSLEIYINDDMEYSFTKNGAAVSLGDVKADDILLIKYNAVADFSDSEFYNITVSDDTVSGVVTENGMDGCGREYYVINDTPYYVENNMNVSIYIGSEYIFSLSAAGKIAAVHNSAANMNIGIVERAYYSCTGSNTAVIIGKDGVRNTYEIHDRNELDVSSWIAAGVASDRYQGDGNDLADRIVNYRVTSSNTVRMDKDDLIVVQDTAAEYQESASMLGQWKIDDATIFIDVLECYDPVTKKGGDGNACVLTKDMLVDGIEYNIIAVRGSTELASAPVSLVIITSGFGEFSVNTRMAVVSKVSSVMVDGIIRDNLYVYVDGEFVNILTEDSHTGLAEGDPIIYTLNAEGRAENIINVFSDDYRLCNAENYTNRYNYLSAIANAYGANNEERLSAQGKAVTNSLLPDLKNSNGEVEYVFGPVLDRTSSGITLGVVKTGTINDIGKQYLLSDPTKTSAYYAEESGVYYDYESTDISIYIFDGEMKPSYRISSGGPLSVMPSFYGKASTSTLSFIDIAGSCVNLGAEGEEEATNKVAFALLKLYNGSVREVYSITMDIDESQSCSWIAPQLLPDAVW